MKSFIFVTIIAVMIIGNVVTACRKASTQVEAEHEVVYRIKNMLALYEGENPGAHVTNLAQLFSGLRKEYPHVWHEQFAAFGSRAGFKNSFFEKYIFVPLGVTNQAVEGEIVLLNAEPFPDEENKLGRMVVSKVNSKYRDCRIRWFREESIKQIIKDTGIENLKATPMPPPPPAPREEKYHAPLSVRVSEFFAVWADQLGLGMDKGWVLQRAAFILLLIVVALPAGWFAFKWIRRSGD